MLSCGLAQCPRISPLCMCGSRWCLCKPRNLAHCPALARRGAGYNPHTRTLSAPHLRKLSVMEYSSVSLRCCVCSTLTPGVKLRPVVYLRRVRYASHYQTHNPLGAFFRLCHITAVPLEPYENGPGTPCAGMMGLSKPTENIGGTKPVAHNDTVFAQVLKLVPRHEFESLARKHKSGRMSRSMTRWAHASPHFASIRSRRKPLDTPAVP